MPASNSLIESGAGSQRMFRFVNEVVCGFCQGSGVDPKLGSRCPVCGSSGMICVIPPVVTCLRCCGTGRENGDLTCLACEGTGAVQVRAQAAPCTACGQTGTAGIFYCRLCKGQGVV